MSCAGSASITLCSWTYVPRWLCAILVVTQCHLPPMSGRWALTASSINSLYRPYISFSYCMFIHLFLMNEWLQWLHLLYHGILPKTPGPRAPLWHVMFSTRSGTWCVPNDVRRQQMHSALIHPHRVHRVHLAHGSVWKNGDSMVKWIGYPPGNDHISHQRNWKIIFKSALVGDMLVPREVNWLYFNLNTLWWCILFAILSIGSIA